MPQNRKLQNLIENKYMADNAVGNAEMRDDAIGNAELGAYQPKHLRFTYDHAALTGDVGAITLVGPTGAQTIPDNAVITRAYLEAVTTTTSDGSATIKLGITGDDDCFIAATARNNAVYAGGAATELTAGIPIKTTSAVSVLATVATAALTAGEFYVWVEYYEGA